MESFPLEVPAWNSCFVVYDENYQGLQVLEHKKIHAARIMLLKVNKLPLSELWELMVDGKKSVLSRVLFISSLPHSREFKRLSTSLFSLSLQSSAVGDVKVRCYYQII